MPGEQEAAYAIKLGLLELGKSIEKSAKTIASAIEATIPIELDDDESKDS